MLIEKAQPFKAQVIALLQSEKLPVSDLPDSLDNFLVMLNNEEVIGIAGVEFYGNYGLLRSLAVKQTHRGAGIAGELMSRIAHLSISKGLTHLYLLTETAPEYFEKKGFVKIDRGDAPAEIRQSSEFSHVCPASAIVMIKKLNL
jgi:amino-acid N-acetyltransferase